MTDEQTAAYVVGQSACALVEMEAMKAANKEREFRGEAPAYSESDFTSLIDKYCIHHNAVLSLFQR